MGVGTCRLEAGPGVGDLLRGDEHTFRYNHRSDHVLTRMGEAAKAMQGRRLTWRELVVERATQPVPVGDPFQGLLITKPD